MVPSAVSVARPSRLSQSAQPLIVLRRVSARRGGRKKGDQACATGENASHWISPCYSLTFILWFCDRLCSSAGPDRSSTCIQVGGDVNVSDASSSSCSGAPFRTEYSGCLPAQSDKI